MLFLFWKNLKRHLIIYGCIFVKWANCPWRQRMIIMLKWNCWYRYIMIIILSTIDKFHKLLIFCQAIVIVLMLPLQEILFHVTYGDAAYILTYMIYGEINPLIYLAFSSTLKRMWLRKKTKVAVTIVQPIKSTTNESLSIDWFGFTDFKQSSAMYGYNVGTFWLLR